MRQPRSRACLFWNSYRSCSASAGLAPLQRPVPFGTRQSSATAVQSWAGCSRPSIHAVWTRSRDCWPVRSRPTCRAEATYIGATAIPTEGRRVCRGSSWDGCSTGISRSTARSHSAGEFGRTRGGLDTCVR